MTLAVHIPQDRAGRLTAGVPRARGTRPKAAPRPFTVAHFRAWASECILDTDKPWHPEPFQDAFLEDVFAGIPECWLVVPEGNGKTTLVAGLALYHCEFRPHATVAIAASSRDQAEIMYRQAEGFVLRSERLHEVMHSPVQEAKGKRKTQVPRFTPLEGYRRVVHAEGGRIQVFAADDRTGDGIIPTLGIIDEMHRHRDLGLYRTWAGKLQKRGGQIVGISTAGEPGSDFEKTREHIRQSAASVVRKGSFIRASSKRLVLHEWAVPEKADVEDMAVVKSANPFSAITVQTLRDKRSSETMILEHWRRFVCNVPTRGNNAAIQEAEWARAETTDVIPAGEPIWVGLDYAYKWDTTALVPLWFRDPEYRLLGPAEIIVPPRDGTSLDPALIRAALLKIHARNPVHTVVMDLSKGGPSEAVWIEDTIGATVVEHSETNSSLSNDYALFMEALRHGWLRHPPTGKDGGMTQHVMNAVARLLPTGDARFDRPAEARRSGQQDQRVIDALSAASMVHALAAVRPEPKPPSKYETEGLLMVGGGTPKAKVAVSA